jgi:hypothetical protein
MYLSHVGVFKTLVTSLISSRTFLKPERPHISELPLCFDQPDIFGEQRGVQTTNPSRTNHIIVALKKTISLYSENVTQLKLGSSSVLIEDQNDHWVALVAL